MNATPESIRELRLAAGLTQADAAKLTHLGSASRWAEYESGRRKPDQARWDWFLLQIGKHPRFRLVQR